MTEPILRIRGLHKRVGDNHVLRGIDLDVMSGDRIALLGASGSGSCSTSRHRRSTPNWWARCWA